MCAYVWGVGSEGVGEGMSVCVCVWGGYVCGYGGMCEGVGRFMCWGMCVGKKKGSQSHT